MCKFYIFLCLLAKNKKWWGKGQGAEGEFETANFKYTISTINLQCFV